MIKPERKVETVADPGEIDHDLTVKEQNADDHRGERGRQHERFLDTAPIIRNDQDQ